MKLFIALFALLLISWKSMDYLPLSKEDVEINDTPQLSSGLHAEDQWETSEDFFRLLKWNRKF